MTSEDDNMIAEIYQQISKSLSFRRHLKSRSRGGGERVKDLLQPASSNERLLQSPVHVKVFRNCRRPRSGSRISTRDPETVHDKLRPYMISIFSFDSTK
jgi:hypothetical protein